MPNITLASIKTRLIRRNSLDSTYTDDIFLEDAHYIAQDIWSAVQYARRWYYSFDIWAGDTISLQDEYTVKTGVTSTTTGIDFLESVSIERDSETYADTGDKTYKLCRVATAEEQKDWVRLLQEQDSEDPIYFYADGSVFIAPDIRTTEAGVGRLRLTGVRSLASGGWTTATTETGIKLPIFMFDVLFYWLRWKSSEHMLREDAMLNNQFTFYRNELNRALKKMNIEQVELMEKPTIYNPLWIQ